MSNPLVSEIKLFGPGWPPRQWALCTGTVIAISGNDSFFSVVGTTYGGDGRSTVGLPETRGRIGTGYGQGPGLTDRPLGHLYGQDEVVLSVNNLPAHNHAAAVDATRLSPTLNATATAVNPTGTASAAVTVADNQDSNLSQSPNPVDRYYSNNNRFENYYSGSKNDKMASDMVDVGVSIDSLTIPITVQGSVTLSTQADAVVTEHVGNGFPFEVTQPAIAMNYIIALQGTYPARN